MTEQYALIMASSWENRTTWVRVGFAEGQGQSLASGWLEDKNQQSNPGSSILKTQVLSAILILQMRRLRLGKESVWGSTAGKAQAL